MAKMTPEEAAWAEKGAKLRELIRFEGWDTYLDLLDTLEDESYEELLHSTVESFRYWQGYIKGLQKARSLPDDLLQRL